MTRIGNYRVVCHYGDQWSVFSRSDRYDERRCFWSHDRDAAIRFAAARTAWCRGGFVKEQMPLGFNADGSVYRIRDFEARIAA